MTKEELASYTVPKISWAKNLTRDELINYLPALSSTLPKSLLTRLLQEFDVPVEEK